MSVQPPLVESAIDLRHVLRVPLSHIIGFTEMLAKDVSELHVPTAASSLKTILAEARSIGDILQQLGAETDPAASHVILPGLQQRLYGPASQIQECVAKLQGLNEADIGIIRTAAAELLAFAEAGKLPGASSEATAKVSDGQLPGASVRTNLLLISSDESNCDSVLSHLVKLGYSVRAEQTHEGGIERLKSENVDGLLLDLDLPDKRGLDLLDSFRSDQTLAGVPILVFSAPGDFAGITQAIEHGAEEYVLTPFDPVLLGARVSAMLERKRLRDGDRLGTARLQRLTFALNRSNEDLQRFAYAASHDLQAPVRTMTTYMQLLRRRLKLRLKDDEGEMFDFAEDAAVRMRKLIQDMLEYSRATTQETRLQTVNSEQILTALLSELRQPVEAAGAIVTWEGLPIVVYDGGRMQQIFRILIDNAVKYRGVERLRIHVWASAVNDYWRFCVRDNGQGISSEHQRRVFEMFKRLHGEEIPGSGIGLAICKRIVERAGGNIWVDSDAGSGSTFCFTVPLVAPATQADSNTVSSESAG